MKDQSTDVDGIRPSGDRADPSVREAARPRAPIASLRHRKLFDRYLTGASLDPLLILGDARQVLTDLPDNSVDCVMTSPPYWGKREYENGGIGLEQDYRDYVKRLASVSWELKRVLKPTGSYWLNLGDRYQNKGLLGIPWRVAFELTDQQGWTLRNSVVWNKVKSGMDTAKDRLGNIHEQVFHFVKEPKGYYYAVDAIRSKARQATVRDGKVISATGVSGIRYKRQIALSTALSDREKSVAHEALEKMLSEVASGRVSDFRMIIRGQQRTTHSDSERVSGRARELQEKGFYFLRYHPKGSKPSDVWDIVPEDTQGRELHFAPFPPDLCRIPILSTCPPDGVVLDPFCGTGTALYVARGLGRKSVGIDISKRYLEVAEKRCSLP